MERLKCEIGGNEIIFYHIILRLVGKIKCRKRDKDGRVFCLYATSTSPIYDLYMGNFKGE